MEDNDSLRNITLQQPKTTMKDNEKGYKNTKDEKTFPSSSLHDCMLTKTIIIIAPVATLNEAIFSKGWIFALWKKLKFNPCITPNICTKDAITHQSLQKTTFLINTRGTLQGMNSCQTLSWLHHLNLSHVLFPPLQFSCTMFKHMCRVH